MQYIGQTYPIHDAPAKVQGQIRYTGDMTLPGMLHAELLLSTEPHARIVSIDTADAQALPGVFGVFTFRDAPDLRFSSARLVPDEDGCVEDEPLFAQTVRYVGDRVAAVVARDADTAREAVRRIRVAYDPLPMVAGIRQVHQETGFGDPSAAEVVGRYAFDIVSDPAPSSDPAACREIETLVYTPRTHHAAMENHVCLADYSAADGLTLLTPCQGAFGVRTTVADLLGLPYTRVRVIKTPMGGSFGGKQEALLEPVAAFLALKLQQPVKLQLDRRSCMIATMTRPATLTSIRSRVTDDGRLETCRMDSLLDAGAYVSSSKAYIKALGSKIFRAYRVGRAVHTARALRTNTPKAGGARGWGSPEFFTAMEIHMDRIAGRLGMDPLALRLRNTVKSGDRDPVRKVSLGRVGLDACLRRGAAAFDWPRKRSTAPGTGRWRRGTGMACGGHTNSMVGGFVDFSAMRLRLNEDGTVVLNTAVHDMGCGTVTSLQQIVAEVLTIPPASIQVLEADTLRSPYDFGTYASRVTYVCGACARKAALKLRQKLLGTAQWVLQVPKQDLALADGRIRVKERAGDNGLDFKAVSRAAMLEYGLPLAAAAVNTVTTNPGSYGAHFCVAAVDTCTGLVQVEDYLAAHDVGRAVNPGMVEGQIQGAVQMGIGYALTEELRLDDVGRMKTDGLKDYHLINAPDMPDVRVVLLEGGGDKGPFGAKSIGEIALVPVAAAVVNAVNHALGTHLSDLPLRPEKILAALDERRT